MLGPNCLGVFDAPADLDLASNEFPAGSIGLISQSGNLAIEIGLMAAEVGLGISRFASLGNQADLEVADVVRAYVDHEATTMIAIYGEDFRDGRAFARAAQDAVACRQARARPHGRSERGERTRGAVPHGRPGERPRRRRRGLPGGGCDPRRNARASSSTSPRPSSSARRCGDGVSRSPETAAVTARSRPTSLPATGSSFPGSPEPVSAQLAAMLPLTATTRNPVDLAGGGEQDISSFGRVVSALLDRGEVDSVLLTGYFGGYSQYSRRLRGAGGGRGRVMADRVDATGRPLVVHTMYWASPPARALRERGVPVYPGRRGRRRRARAPRGAPGRSRSWGVPDLPPAREAGGRRPDYFEARELLAASGIAFAEARRVTGWDEARSAAEELGFPVVLKALGSLHKSDSGGVVVGLADEAALERAYADLIDRLGPPELLGRGDGDRSPPASS